MDYQTKQEVGTNDPEVTVYGYKSTEENMFHTYLTEQFWLSLRDKSNE